MLLAPPPVTDIKEVKKALLDAFNSAGAPPKEVAKEDALDSVLRVYFAKAAHVPRPLVFEAVMNCLKIAPHDQALSRQKAHIILKKYHHHPPTG
jgi:hypothetical protein